MNPPAPSRLSRQLNHLVTWSAAASTGLAAGFLASVEQVNPAVEFRFTAFSVVAFLTAGALSLALLRRTFRMLHSGAAAGESRLRRLAPIVLLAAGSGAILFASTVVAVKNLSPDRRTDFLAGTVIAFVVVLGLGWFSWKIMRFLGSADEDARNPERDSTRDPP